MLKYALVVGACAIPCFGGELAHSLDAQIETVKLEYTFDTDGPISYAITQSQSMSQDMMGQLSETSETKSLVVDRELLEIQDDGTLVLVQRSKSYSFTENSAEGVFEFDSTNSDHDSLQSDIRVAAEVESFGWNIEILMSPQGDIVGLHNADEISALVQKVGDSEVQDELADMFSLEIITSDYGPFWHVLPEQAVGLGDKWDRVYTVLDDDSTFVFNQTMTVKKIEKAKGGEIVHVDITGTIDVVFAGIPPFIKPVKNLYAGSFVFNTVMGTVTNFESTFYLDLAGSPGEGMGEFKMSSKLGMKYEIIDN